MSTLKRTKTKQRNRLKQQTLDDVMRISTETKNDADYDVTEAYESWLDDNPRRINCKMTKG